MKAMVLAAGQGTRLNPLTLATPKPMIPIGNIPLLERTLRWLAREGIRDVMINLHHLPQQIKNYVGNGRIFGTNVTYSFEETLLGTAGAVKNCRDFFGDEHFIVIYGDNLVDVHLAPLNDIFAQTSADAVLGTFKPADPTACGLILTDDVGRITKFQEKPPLDQVFTDRANAGVYLLSAKVFDYIETDRSVDFGKDVFPAMLLDECNLQALTLDGYIQDTGTPENYRKANEDALTGKIFGLRGKLISNNPNFTLIGDQAHLGPNVSFSGSNIIGARTRIGAGAKLTNSIIWEDVKIPEDLILDGAIVGSGVQINPGDAVESYSLIG